MTDSPPPAADRAAVAAPPSRKVRRLTVLGVFATVVAGGFAAANAKSLLGGDPADPSEPRPIAPVSVEVVSPRPGGIDRVCVQPGTIEPFEAADLYAKVSGFLEEQTVDIGSRVKKGEVLARLSVPEYQKQYDKQTREIERARAKVDQMKAAVVAAEADERAAAATVKLAEAEVRSKTSYLKYRTTQRDRLRDLFAQKAIDARAVDEQEDQYQAAEAACAAAQEAVNAARQRAEAARAKVTGAKADQKLAEAEVTVAQAELERTQVLLDYTVIRSPYDGVVTKRNFSRGEFIRAADSGGERAPLLAVERTDVMRLVIQVPDRDVPYVDVGDRAIVEIDALAGATFTAPGGVLPTVSRRADAEDPQSRTMRTEVDLANPSRELRRGMYGQVRLILQPGTPSAVRVPSAALVGKAEGGRGTVRVVRGDRVHVVPVRYGTDTGVEVEILSGLTPQDHVVVMTNGPIDDGTVVTTSDNEHDGH
jgi:RND family efflux transporter MFP subunit